MSKQNSRRIEIRNFGPIKAFDFSLDDDFVLIVGENNVGKSYAISLVYATLKTLLSSGLIHMPSDFFLEGGDLAEGNEILIWLKEFEAQQSVETSESDVNVTSAVLGHLRVLIQNLILPSLRDSLLGTFNDVANLQNKQTTEPMSLRLCSGTASIEFRLDEQGELSVANFELQHQSFSVRRVKQNRTYLESGYSTVIYYPLDNPSQFEGNYQTLIWRICTRFIQGFVTDIADLHYLPASRSGLYQALSAFGQIVAELAKNRTLLSRKIELPGIAEPLSDYFLKLSEVRPINPSEQSQPFHHIAELIEHEILHGKVEFDAKTKRLTYSPHNVELKLDLSATSSMVSEISPIVSYLKLVLPNSLRQGTRRRRFYPGSKNSSLKQIIIIEEPEAHLHPDVQQKLVTIFAQLVGTTGSRLIMTSHSNYIFNKTSNLVIAGAIDQSRFRAIQFIRTDEGSTTHDLRVSKVGVHDENFVDTAEAIYQERLNLLKKSNG